MYIFICMHMYEYIKDDALTVWVIKIKTNLSKFANVNVLFLWHDKPCHFL